VDNLEHARPLLERYDFPATVFVTSGYVGQTREFWWDELARLLLHPGTSSEVLQLQIGEEQQQWELGKAASYSRHDYDRYHEWNYGSDIEPSARHRVFRALYRRLSPLSDSERNEVLGALRSQITLHEPSATHRVLTPAEVVRLAEGGLVEIGAHTVNHPVLASLPLAAQRQEVEGSKSRLEEILGRAVTSFAYPYGSRARSDYTPETVAIVRDAGFSCACSNLAQPVRPGIDLFQIARAGTRDWDGESLARRLDTWLQA
jgi:peptidoglycan/xylan/chitin deacetylase (PgdA/CDA1 family)